MTLTIEELIRYARQITLPEIGLDGQAVLKRAHVAVIGAGGLGAPLLMHLAASGVGTITIIDPDKVALSNLPRQILYDTSTIDTPKAEAAASRLKAMNPMIQYHPMVQSFSPDLLAWDQIDLVCDCTDNFTSRFEINRACVEHRTTLVTAAVSGFSGYLTTIKPHISPSLPCYRCFHPDIPKEPEANCRDGGVLGSIAAQVATAQATESIKELLQIGRSLAGTLLTIAPLTHGYRAIAIPKRDDCPCCG